MKNESVEICRLAKLILDEIENSKIFGVPFDMENENHLLAGAYLLGFNKTLYNKSNLLSQSEK